jgi:hypothetical protein
LTGKAKKPMYVIVDENNAILRLRNAPLYGNYVELLACFHNETDALKTLFVLEQEGLIEGHRVENTGDTFYVEPELPVQRGKLFLIDKTNG